MIRLWHKLKCGLNFHTLGWHTSQTYGIGDHSVHWYTCYYCKETVVISV